MSKKPKPELTDSDNPEWTAQDIQTSVPFSGLPTTFASQSCAGVDRKSTTQDIHHHPPVPEVVQAFRAGGDGWQTRIDAALKDWLRTHTLSA